MTSVLRLHANTRAAQSFHRAVALELAGHGRPADAHGPFPGALWLQVRDIAGDPGGITRTRCRSPGEFGRSPGDW